MNSITALMNALRLANNGYIPLRLLDAAGLRQVAKAEARGIVKVKNGLVMLPAAAEALAADQRDRRKAHETALLAALGA